MISGLTAQLADCGSHKPNVVPGCDTTGTSAVQARLLPETATNGSAVSSVDTADAMAVRTACTAWAHERPATSSRRLGWLVKHAETGPEPACGDGTGRPCIQVPAHMLGTARTAMSRSICCIAAPWDVGPCCAQVDTAVIKQAGSTALVPPA